MGCHQGEVGMNFGPRWCGSAVGAHSHNITQTAGGKIPGMGAYDPWSRHVWEATNQCFSLTLMLLSLLSSLSESNAKMSMGEDENKRKNELCTVS